jgi:hypothetical protein
MIAYSKGVTQQSLLIDAIFDLSTRTMYHVSHVQQTTKAEQPVLHLPA